MSCFSLDGNHQSVHIAFRQKETQCITVSYLTLKSKQAPIVQNTGTHFCPFEIAETKLNKEKAKLNMTDYAVMLPLTCGTSSCDSGLYILVYSDWHVLQCSENKGAEKGPVTVDIETVSDVSKTLVEGLLQPRPREDRGQKELQSCNQGWSQGHRRQKCFCGCLSQPSTLPLFSALHHQSPNFLLQKRT